MKILLLIGIYFFSINMLSAQEFPEPMSPPRLVNDFAGLLTNDQSRMLENKLRNYYDTTSTQIAIVTLQSIDGTDAGMYAPELAERWGIGKAGKDNGLLILVAFQEREVRIATGYGLEPTVTDAASKRIIENYIRPNFRRKDYFEGLDQATSIIMSLAAGEFEADQIRGNEGNAAPVFLIFLVLFFLVILPLMRHRAVKKSHFGNKPIDFFTAMMLMNAMKGKRGGGFGDFKGGRGGFGGGGGGFGGFGGGSFGGGGAGGSW
ncbi:hypothetical protein BH23BAC1_BH23BAC1_45170 [soil metagenome]